ncbi:MAG: periplasmic nitrate reductase, NapE protein [Methyloligellaceae bacterium]
MATDQEVKTTPEPASQKKLEVRSFLFLAIFMAPALAIAFVGSLGLLIWIYQMIAGPPGPPA